uniref:Uncharacterized protein n=1 Tax=Rhizophagus irregularis (strain DAOM 181602 / DAOM 197198 / MUCL 43194) TaxID=747089 RepID=U9T9V3_RHIID
MELSFDIDISMETSQEARECDNELIQQKRLFLTGVTGNDGFLPATFCPLINCE